MTDARIEYEKWLASPALTQAEKDELAKIDCDAGEIESRFYGALEFGTAGLRGVMGLGTARMNVYVIRQATQAFADVINRSGDGNRGAAVCYDCRLNSREFAEAAATVLAANGIPVKIFESMRPTPELSFAVREYGLAAGINITASHNPKEYNGYKVYGDDGAQLSPVHADAVSARIAELDIFSDINSVSFDDAVASGRITVLSRETDELFLKNVYSMINDEAAVERVADGFTMVYTPFHGTGYRLVPEALKRLGVKNLICVPEQMEPDGTFPTVVSPNPENPEGFYLAERLADEHNADFILGTDPDADRVGIMIRGRDGRFIPVSGNKTGVLLLDYLIGAMRRSGKLPEQPVVLKTIVTTEMARRVAEANGVLCFDTFTGFKFMAEKKNALEDAGEGKVIFSYEESYGYMVGDYVRDKDAVTASVLLTEMTAWYAGRGMTLLDALDELFEKYGYYDERTINLIMPGLDGKRQMQALMHTLRSSPPGDVAGDEIVTRCDYLTGEITDCADGKKAQSELSGSDVLRFILKNGTSVIIRPSGTEPKIKVYILSHGECRRECDENLEKYSVWAHTLAEQKD